MTRARGTVAEATSASPDRYFARLDDAWRTAVDRGGEVSLDVSIGPWPLRIAFASNELARALVPALTRLIVAPGGPVLATMRAWDSASTGTRLPSPPWPAGAVQARGAVEGYNDARFRTFYRYGDSGFDALSMFDARERVGLFWFAHHERIHWYERAEPLRPGIHWALTTDRRRIVHASAVGDARGAIVLTGSGGAGKTTTTLASIEAGLSFVGDNYVLLSLDGEPTVYGLYGTAKLWPGTLEKLPQLAPLVRTFDVAPDEKLVVDIAESRRVATGLPIRAVVVPRVAGAGVARVRPCSAVQALLALAPTTIFDLPHTDGGLGVMAELVRRVPTYSLELGEDVMGGPRALSDLLDVLAP